MADSAGNSSRSTRQSASARVISIHLPWRSIANLSTSASSHVERFDPFVLRTTAKAPKTGTVGTVAADKSPTALGKSVSALNATREPDCGRHIARRLQAHHRRTGAPSQAAARDFSLRDVVRHGRSEARCAASIRRVSTPPGLAPIRARVERRVLNSANRVRRAS